MCFSPPRQNMMSVSFSSHSVEWSEIMESEREGRFNSVEHNGQQWPPPCRTLLLCCFYVISGIWWVTRDSTGTPSPGEQRSQSHMTGLRMSSGAHGRFDWQPRLFFCLSLSNDMTPLSDCFLGLFCNCHIITDKSSPPSQNCMIWIATRL